MKILFSSYAYKPGVGGIETVSALLAREFVTAGHEVHLVTETTKAADEVGDSFPVTRQPNFSDLTRLVRWCDVIFQNNVSLRHLVPALLGRKPVLVVHQTWIRNTRGQITWNSRIKRTLLRRTKNVAISHAIASDIGLPMKMLGNPYDDSIFKIIPNSKQSRSIVFVGRLVSDKGADLLLEAFSKLRAHDAVLTIVGGGPEEGNLRRLTSELGISERVSFLGVKSGAELAALMNAHQIIVIPSRWPEPFGVVALEGIACDCVAVGSDEGGLKDVVGPCGMTFPNGDVAELTKRIDELLEDEALRDKFRAAAPAHLTQFRPHEVARRYLELLRQLAA